MIQANELRIGNLFQDSKSKTLISVIGLTKEIITFSGHFKNDWQAEQIPLTEQWLIDFGFKQYDCWDGQFYFSTSKDSDFELYERNLEFNFSNFKIKHVHQLQNLYFALTGIELIKQ
jgi:hypothetical protein